MVKLYGMCFLSQFFRKQLNAQVMSNMHEVTKSEFIALKYRPDVERQKEEWKNQVDDPTYTKVLEGEKKIQANRQIRESGPHKTRKVDRRSFGKEVGTQGRVSEVTKQIKLWPDRPDR